METQTDIPQTGLREALAWRKYRDNPIEVARKVLEIPERYLWDGVLEMFDSVMKNRKTAVQAGHAMSKDWTAGLLTLTWLLIYWGEAKVIITAPKMEQVKTIIFNEIAVQYARLRARFPEFPKDALSSNRLYFGPECFALGMTTKEGESMDALSKTSSKFSGFHSPNMLIIISESQGVEPAIYKQIRGLMTSPNSRLLEIGNPLEPYGDFYDHCTKPGYGYNNIKIPVFLSPNIIAGREVIRGMCSQVWLDEIQNDCGPDYQDDPQYQARAMAVFPEQSAMAWIPLSKIMACVQKYRSLKASNPDKMLVGGLDIAGEGDDETVFTVLEGVCMEMQHHFRKILTPETIGWAKNLILNENVEGFAIDYGYDQGVTNMLAFDRMPVIKILFGEKSPSEKFSNFGTYMWGLLREAIMNESVGLLNDPILISQLSSRRMEPQPDGKLRLQSKRKSKRASPDRGDALALAWYMRLMLLSGDNIEASALNAAASLNSEIERYETEHARRPAAKKKEEDMDDIGIIGEATLEADDIPY